MSAIGTKLSIEAAVRLDTLIDTHARDAGRQLGAWLRPWLQSTPLVQRPRRTRKEVQM